jgi:hypothetical protein
VLRLDVTLWSRNSGSEEAAAMQTKLPRCVPRIGRENQRLS